jgi:hypothetical protein
MFIQLFFAVFLFPWSLATTSLALKGERLEFVASKDMTVYYNQTRPQGNMRSIFFQKGQTFTADQPLASKVDWCGLQVLLKLDENTTVARGAVLTPYSFEELDNGGGVKTYSWNFLNTESAKADRGTSRYALFAFNCVVKKDTVLDAATLSQILGTNLAWRLRD